MQLNKLFLVSFFFCVGIASEKERSKCAAQRAIERDKEIVSYIHERERERRHLTRTQLHKRHSDRNTERERKRDIKRERQRQRVFRVCVCERDRVASDRSID